MSSTTVRCQSCRAARRSACSSAQALFGDPQALLLDEPTNYLDLDSVHWLQDFPHPLQRHASSPSRTIATSSTPSAPTLQTSITRPSLLYNGGYDDMVLQKTSIRTRIESQNEQREKKIEQLNDFIARFSAGTRSSAGQLA